MWYQINRFHICAFITWQFANFFAGQNIFGIYSNYVPKWKCRGSPPTSDCNVYKSCPKGDLVHVDPMFNSAAMEFEWICGDTVYYQSLFSQIQYFGVLIGTFFFGSLSDKFGRKPIGILVLAMGICTTFASGMAPDHKVLFSLRFLVGLSIGGSLVVLCTWIMEVILPQQRMVLRGFFNWGWTRIFLTIICYFAREWRLASFVTAACLLPALLLVVFIIPESPIWLHSKGLKSRMIQSEVFIARIAGVPYVPVEHKLIRPKTLMQTLKTKGLFKKLFSLWIMWFIVAVCGFANDLNSNTLSGNLYVNQILFGILLVFSKMLLLFADTHFENFKRRTLHQGSQIGTLICFMTLGAFWTSGYHGIGFLIIYLLGTAFIEYNWDACYLIAIESMETSSRASATGSCSLMARVGSILAPMVTFANTYWSGSVYFVVIGLGTLNLFISYFFLQETKNVNLDDVHVDEDEKIPEECPMVQRVRD